MSVAHPHLLLWGGGEVTWRVHNWALMGNREFVEGQAHLMRELGKPLELETLLQSKKREEWVRQPHSQELTLPGPGIVLVAAWQLGAATSPGRAEEVEK